MIKEVSTFHSGKYVFSADIRTDLSVLSEAVNVFWRMPVFPDTLFRYKTDALEKAIHAEARLEESSITIDQVRGIIKHDRSNFSQDTQAIETINLYMAHMLVNSKSDSALTQELINSLHTELITGLSKVKDIPGHFRTGGPAADKKWLSADYTPPASTLDINFLIKHLFEWMEKDLQHVNPIIKAALVHLHLKKIQPFCNANGHTARLAETLLLKKSGIKILPYLMPVIYNEGRAEYYKCVSEFYATSDITPFVKFLSSRLKDIVEQIRDENFKVMSEVISSHYLTKLLNEKTLIKRQYDFLCTVKDGNLTFSYEDLQLRKPFVKYYGGVSRTTVARDIKKFEELDLIVGTEKGYVFNHDTLKNQ